MINVQRRIRYVIMLHYNDDSHIKDVQRRSRYVIVLHYNDDSHIKDVQRRSRYVIVLHYNDDSHIKDVQRRSRYVIVLHYNDDSHIKDIILTITHISHTFLPSQPQTYHTVIMVKMVPYEAFVCPCGAEDVVLRESYKPKTRALLFNSLSKTLSDVIFLWKEERVRLLVGSPGASTTPIYSPGSSSTPIYSLGSSTPPRYLHELQ
nr:hypothetical protein [Tanacetum cinerariifolium]